MPWRRSKLRIYGREVEVLLRAITCLWPSVAGQQLVRVAITRDPKGCIADRAYFVTEPEMEAEELLERFSRRWLLEVCFRNAKQYLGLEDPQNGWSRGKRPTGRGRKRAGPQPRGRRGETATIHTVPIIFVTYAVVILWYLDHGHRERDLREIGQRSPWYRSKRAPSFADMLDALRAETWAGRICEDPGNPGLLKKLRERLSPALRCA